MTIQVLCFSLYAASQFISRYEEKTHSQLRRRILTMARLLSLEASSPFCYISAGWRRAKLCNFPSETRQLAGLSPCASP